MRPNDRALDQLRDITIETGVSPYAEGSCLIKCGNTHVLCTASVDPGVPRWLKGKGRGWVTAEYGMLPRSPIHVCVGRQHGVAKVVAPWKSSV